MILRIRHKGLRLLYEENRAHGVDSRHLKKLQALLTRLEGARIPADMDFPGLRFHPLRGDLAGFYAVDVSANWRMIFRFEDENATDVDLIDYH